MEARFGPFGDRVNLDARLVHNLHQTCKKAQKSFWAHLMELLGDVGEVEARFGPFGISVNLSAI
jgi:hypothetical protein